MLKYMNAFVEYEAAYTCFVPKFEQLLLEGIEIRFRCEFRLSILNSRFDIYSYGIRHTPCA